MKQKSLDILGSDFNSTMVRLKAQFANPYPQMEMDFNSTMVRLKENGISYFFIYLEFQFHYGTIKRAGREAVRGDGA